MKKIFELSTVFLLLVLSGSSLRAEDLEAIPLEEAPPPYRPFRTISCGKLNGREKSDFLGAVDRDCDGRSEVLAVNNGDLSLAVPDGERLTWQRLGNIGEDTSEYLIAVSSSEGHRCRNTVRLFHRTRQELVVVELHVDGTFRTSRFGALSTLPSSRSEMFAGDFTGDGLQDLLFRVHNNFAPSTWISVAGSTGFTQPNQWEADSPPNTKMLTGLLNPDGLSDMLRIPQAGGEITATISEGVGRYAREAVWAEIPAIGDWSERVLLDADGDGFDDLFLRNTVLRSDWLILSRARTGIELPIDQPVFEEEMKPNAPPGHLVAGDFNGDGRGDLVRFGKECELAYSEAPLPEDLPSAPPIVSMQPQGPFVCIGYNPGTSPRKWGRVEGECPMNYAFIEADDASPEHFSGTCCPLPGEDVLGEAVIAAENQCPAEYIATGRDPATGMLRCRELNRKRFSLGEAVSGVYWGAGLSQRGNSSRMSKELLPPAVRSAVGRVGWLAWDVDGCIGPEPGMVLVAVFGEACSSLRFASIRSESGSASSRPAVPLYPDCAPVNIFSPVSGCGKEEAEGLR